MKIIIGRSEKIGESEQQSVQRQRNAQTFKRTRKHIGARILLISISLLYLVPFYWMLNTALKSNPELAIIPPTLFPRSWEWDNFAKALITIPFPRYFFNTVIYTSLVVIGAVCSNFIVAYGFSCIEWPGRDVVFYLVLITIFIPFPIAIIPLFDLFVWLHWINTLLPLIVPAFLGSAFYIFLLRQFLLQLP